MISTRHAGRRRRPIAVLIATRAAAAAHAPVPATVTHGADHAPASAMAGGAQ